MGILRVILALTVVIHHSKDTLFGLKFTGGVVSVDVFFIISGFYMALILSDKYIGKGSYILFLSNRFLRLFPIYWVVLIFTLAISAASYQISHEGGRFDYFVNYYDRMAPETAVFLIMSNVMMFGQDLVMFLGMDPEKGTLYFTSNYRYTNPALNKFMLVPQAWSLSLELMFYLIAPLLARRKLGIILLLIMITIGIRLFVSNELGYTHDPWKHRFFPSALIFFLFGIISYRLYLWNQKIKLSRLIRFFIIGAFSLYFISYQFIPASVVAPQFKNWILYILTCVSIPVIFDLTKTSRLDRRLGDFSYPIYIVHILFVLGIEILFDRLHLNEYKAEASILLSVMASYLLISFIADPIEKLRQSRISTISKPSGH